MAGAGGGLPFSPVPRRLARRRGGGRARTRDGGFRCLPQTRLLAGARSQGCPARAAARRREPPEEPETEMRAERRCEGARPCAVWAAAAFARGGPLLSTGREWGFEEGST